MGGGVPRDYASSTDPHPGYRRFLPSCQRTHNHREYVCGGVLRVSDFVSADNWSRVTEALVLFGELRSASELRKAAGQLREFVTKMNMWGLLPPLPPKPASQVDFSFL